MNILAGDVGATKTALGLFEPGENRPRLVCSKVYSSWDHPSLESIISQFISERPESITSACFGVPGPVLGGVCRTTNLNWVISSDRLRSLLGIQSVTLLNDLVATAIAAPTLSVNEYDLLNIGNLDVSGTIGVVAPGTGLGMALMVWTGSEYRPVASEGGHVDFAPTDRMQIGLLEAMMRKFPRVSVERLAAGPGLHEIYNWVTDLPEHSGHGRKADVNNSSNPSEMITRLAFEENDPACNQSLDLYVSILGSICGNLALTAMTTGGIYLGGGVSPKILPRLKDGPFMAAFTAKGRFRELMESIPVKIILNDRAALIGASIMAAAG